MKRDFELQDRQRREREQLKQAKQREINRIVQELQQTTGFFQRKRHKALLAELAALQKEP